MQAPSGERHLRMTASANVGNTIAVGIVALMLFGSTTPLLTAAPQEQTQGQNPPTQDQPPASTQPPADSTPPSPQTPSQESPPSSAKSPESSSPSPTDTPGRPRLARRKKAAKKKAPPQSGKVVVRNGGVSDNSAQISPGMNDEQARHQRQNTDQLLTKTGA